MKLENLQWLSVHADELLPLLASGASSIQESLKSFKHSVSASPSRLAVAVISNCDRPCLPVVSVPDDEAADLFAWLYTYAEEAMPLSMHGRVLFQSDAKMLSNGGRDEPLPAFKRWASLIAGEIIFRSGNKVLPEISASWALLSYTFSAALAYASYGEDRTLLSRIFDRILTISSDSQFARNERSPSDFFLLWDICNHLRSPVAEPIEAIVSILQVIAELSRSRDSIHPDSANLETIFGLLRSPQFQSDSLERRLSGFDELLSSLQRNPTGQSFLRSFAVAAGVFLVGRGTSHIHLLSESDERFAGVWFGLLAGLTGERSWDGRWLVVNRRIESLLQFHYQGSGLGPSLTDLSWSEFNWVRQSRGSLDLLRALVKVTPNFVTIELLPGVPLQLRVSKGLRDVRQDIEATNTAGIADRLEEIVRELRRKPSGLSSPSSPDGQQEFKLDAPVKKGRTPRKGS